MSLVLPVPTVLIALVPGGRPDARQALAAGPAVPALSIAGAQAPSNRMTLLQMSLAQ